MTNQAWCYQSALQQARALLNNDQAKLDAEILLSFVTQQNRSHFYTWPEAPLSLQQANVFFQLIEQRRQGQPIAYLTGEREFWGLNLNVTPATLIPRADTETLVEAALYTLQNTTSPKVLDLGTGSGAIALAIKSERPDAQVYAVDRSDAALSVAKQNAQKHHLDITFLTGSWFEPIQDLQFDLILSNPPYIEQNDQHLTQGDLRFEPTSALVAGADGLDDLRLIINQACYYLNQQAWLMVEHGYNQADAVAELFEHAGYQAIELKRDLSGQARVTQGQKP